MKYSEKLNGMLNSIKDDKVLQSDVESEIKKLIMLYFLKSKNPEDSFNRKKLIDYLAYKGIDINLYKKTINKLIDEWFRSESFKEASNDDVVTAFYKGETARSGSMSTDGTKIWSYNTVVAAKDGKNVKINIEKYSHSTDTQVNKIRGMAAQYGYRIIDVGEKELAESIKKKSKRYSEASVDFEVGDKVQLSHDMIQELADFESDTDTRENPYTKEELQRRKILRRLEGSVGKIQRVFPGSTHVNVDFGGTLIGIDRDDLEKAGR